MDKHVFQQHKKTFIAELFNALNLNRYGNYILQNVKNVLKLEIKNSNCSSDKQHVKFLHTFAR